MLPLIHVHVYYCNCQWVIFSDISAAVSYCRASYRMEKHYQLQSLSWDRLVWSDQFHLRQPECPSLVLDINIYARASLRASSSKIGFTGRSKWKEGQLCFLWNRLWDNTTSFLHPVHTNVFVLPIPIKIHALLRIGFHNKVCPLQNRSKCVYPHMYSYQAFPCYPNSLCENWWNKDTNMGHQDYIYTGTNKVKVIWYYEFCHVEMIWLGNLFLPDILCSR